MIISTACGTISVIITTGISRPTMIISMWYHQRHHHHCHLPDVLRASCRMEANAWRQTQVLAVDQAVVNVLGRIVLERACTFSNSLTVAQLFDRTRAFCSACAERSPK